MELISWQQSFWSTDKKKKEKKKKEDWFPSGDATAYVKTCVLLFHVMHIIIFPANNPIFLLISFTQKLRNHFSGWAHRVVQLSTNYHQAPVPISLLLSSHTGTRFTLFIKGISLGHWWIIRNPRTCIYLSSHGLVWYNWDKISWVTFL